MYLGIAREVIEDDRLARPDASDPPEYAKWRWVYSAIDTAYNVRALPGGQDLFESAVRRFHAHPVGRVRGICLDDFYALLKSHLEDRHGGAPKKRLQACRRFFDGFEREATHWVRHAEDCWELEYVQLLFAYLHDHGVLDVGAWLQRCGPRSRYLQGDFHTEERDAFLERIESLAHESAEPALAAQGG